MNKLIGILIGCCIFIACTESNKKSDTNSNSRNSVSTEKTDTSETIEIDSTFKLEYFNPIPDKYLYSGGVGCFTYDTTEMSPGKYILFASESDTASIKINGNEVILVLDTLNSKPRLNDTFQDVWKGMGLTVTLNAKVVNETGSEINCNGILEIRTSKRTMKFKVHGEYSD